MLKQNRIVLAIAGAVSLAIVVLEMVAPANVVGAYGFVVPILLVATVRSRSLMLVTVVACVVATYIGLMQPTKPGRFQAAVINRSVVRRGSFLVVAYIGMTWEERKTREEAARAALARETENLLKANTQLVGAKDRLNALWNASPQWGNWWLPWRMRSERHCTRLPGMCKRWLKSRASRCDEEAGDSDR